MDNMLVYRYGCKKRTAGFDTLLSQLRLANRYRNALIERELWRRAAVFCLRMLADQVSDPDVLAELVGDYGLVPGSKAAQGLPNLGRSSQRQLRAYRI